MHRYFLFCFIKHTKKTPNLLTTHWLILLHTVVWACKLLLGVPAPCLLCQPPCCSEVGPYPRASSSSKTGQTNKQHWPCHDKWWANGMWAEYLSRLWSLQMQSGEDLILIQRVSGLTPSIPSACHVAEVRGWAQAHTWGMRQRVPLSGTK